MAEHVQHIRHIRTDNVDPYVNEDEVVEEPDTAVVTRPTLAARIVMYITELLLILLAFRFVLALLGANPLNGFANFIYTLSRPFVSPFFGLFNYTVHLSISHFELYTLIAMAVYGVIGYAISRALNLTRS